MTDLGKAFVNIAESVDRLHGFGSNKMVTRYTIYLKPDGTEDNDPITTPDDLPYLEQLVRMGYLRKFITSPYLNNPRKQWRFKVKGVCYGLTAKGWEVAPKFLAVYRKQVALDMADLKAKNYVEKVKNTNPITYEEAFNLAIRGIL